jgi:hypothetical protein
MAFVSRSGGQRLRARFVEHRRDTSNMKAQAVFHRESPVEIRSLVNCMCSAVHLV